ncbi:MAG: hypothetical protein Q9170_000272 [Blastenia crenularia]
MHIHFAISICCSSRANRLRVGRSVSACQKAFDSLYSRAFQIPLQPIPPPQPPPSAKPGKRPAPSSDPSTGLNRELQPRGPGFVTVNEPTESTAYPSGLSDSADRRQKKRGRPSKADVEIKAAEYAARGEPYPPPRKSKNRKASAEGTAPMGPSITFTPVTMGPSGMAATSSGKKRTTKTQMQQSEAVPGYGPSASPIRQVYGEAKDPMGTQGPSMQAPPRETSEPAVVSVAAEHGPTTAFGQPIQSEARDPIGTHRPSFQAFPAETSEPTVASVGPAVQDQTAEGRDVADFYQRQSGPAMPPSLSSREPVSTEHGQEAGINTLQTIHPPATSEHGSPNTPNPMHSPKQV